MIKLNVNFRTTVSKLVQVAAEGAWDLQGPLLQLEWCAIYFLGADIILRSSFIPKHTVLSDKFRLFTPNP